MTSEHPQGERGTTPTGEHHSVHDWAHDRTITVRLTGERVELAPYRIAWLAKLVHSTPFEAIIAIVLVINAVALAILTLPNMPPAAILISINLNIAAYVIYVIELILRVVSYGKKPWMFFRRGWNVFDFVVVAAVPLLQEHTALLRLLRLLRLVRILRFLPEVRVLTGSILKSIPPLLSMSVLIALLMFLYGMSGTYLFGEGAPEEWGNILLSLQSLLALLTLDSFGDYFAQAVGITPLAIPFFLTYVFFIVFTVLNVLVGIVLNAMDEARREIAAEKPVAVQVATLSTRIQEAAADGTLSAEEITVLKAELDALQASLDALPAPRAARNAL